MNKALSIRISLLVLFLAVTAYYAGFLSGQRVRERKSAKVGYPVLSSVRLSMNGNWSFIISVSSKQACEVTWMDAKSGDTKQAAVRVPEPRHVFLMNPEYPHTHQGIPVAPHSLDEAVLIGIFEQLFLNMKEAGDQRAIHVGEILKMLKDRQSDPSPSLCYWLYFQQ
jgi:hypothetical protein